MSVLVIVVSVLAVVAGLQPRDDLNTENININLANRANLATLDLKQKEMMIMKLVNYILQPTVYDDIKQVAREWNLEQNKDKYLKPEIVERFLETFKTGMLPREEIFVHTNERNMEQAVQVFRLLHSSKDFDVMVRTACWLRERINPGMFVYALTAAVFHREDCRGIVMPAPYEIYPYLFVENTIINKALMMKMTEAAVDPAMMDYYGINKPADENVVLIDMRKGVRHTMNQDDAVAYFTEDIDLNTYMYHLHMNYPHWMTNETYGVHKERRGEVIMYAHQQLLARLRMERISMNMCDIKMLMWDIPLKTGYWPKLCMHNGECMPMRSNNMMPLNEYNINEKQLLDNMESLIREGILKGHLTLRNGKTVNLKIPEDIEMLSRLLLGGIGLSHDDAKAVHISDLLKRILSYEQYNTNKDTYVPTALDMHMTCLRDPICWSMMKRMVEHTVIFKNMLPAYTREELDFPGVMVESVTTDKLVTFMDEYDVDITNALMLSKHEIEKKRSDMIYVARLRRLNNEPFNINIEVVSDKEIDAVVRIFIGPSYDCIGRLMDINDYRRDMIEIDSFLHKLKTGRNTIVRHSNEMNNAMEDRPMARLLWERVGGSKTINETLMDKDLWAKTRTGWPRRLMLPLGLKNGLPLNMFVIVTPVRTGRLLPQIDMSSMKQRHTCRWTTCIDTMPLGFPFDREIDMSRFLTPNMKSISIQVFRKDMDLMNVSKEVDISNMVMKHDDLTYLDTDMLMSRNHKHMMVMMLLNGSDIHNAIELYD